MQRIIKFRARNKTTGEWFYGSTDNLLQMVGFWELLAVGVLDVETLGQYTGLKDKNGKEIYGGDVVKCKLHFSGFPIECENIVVEYGRFIRENKNAGFYPFYSRINSFEIIESEVISNIYESPELLEVK